MGGTASLVHPDSFTCLTTVSTFLHFLQVGYCSRHLGAGGMGDVVHSR